MRMRIFCKAEIHLPGSGTGFQSGGRDPRGGSWDRENKKEAQSSFNSHLFCTAQNHQNTQKRQHIYRNNSDKKQGVNVLAKARLNWTPPVEWDSH